jgi:hypothetical protein
LAVSDSSIKKTAQQLRDEIEELIREDLIGPRGGKEEELSESPANVYLLGLLAPRFLQEPVPRPDPAGEDDSDSVAADQQPEDPLGSSSEYADSGWEGTAEDRPPAIDQLVPSAFGLTFCVAGDCKALLVKASWGAYSRALSNETVSKDGHAARVWRRRQCGGATRIELPKPGSIKAFAPDDEEPEVIVRGLVRERAGQRLVTLFLVNGQDASDGQSPQSWCYQANLTVQGSDGSGVFVRSPIDTDALTPQIDREELLGLEMLYRSCVELATGHGISVQAVHDPDAPERGVKLETAAMPVQDVPRTEAPSVGDFEDLSISEPFQRAASALDMRILSEADDGALAAMLSPLVEAYESWIELQRGRLSAGEGDLRRHEAAAERHLHEADEAAARIRDGIAAIAAEPDVAEAFRFANHAMWQQRVHTVAAELRRKDPALKLHDAVERADVAERRSWRPFQLAFMLLNLPALADPRHPERTSDALLDLLFFPTGGGKTEAYLGLIAFTIAIRRLQGTVAGRDGRDGVAALMRYTLRLLTLQQFQRAAALLCACEIRRRKLYGDGRTQEQRRWGKTQMRVGLWVGRGSTPNTTEDAARWVKEARERGRAGRGSSPLQLSRCPWCGSALSGGRDITVDKGHTRTLVFCSDESGACPFTPRSSPGEGLPVVVVDEEVYRLLPSLIIATVDKLARMPWEGRTQALFGQVSRYCGRHGYLTPSEQHADSHRAQNGLGPVSVTACEPLRPPDLIIQDELHLISGPLGSLVGLYETAVDALASWQIENQVVHPKIIASTATIRRAKGQVKRLFDRELKVFPPPGLDARDSFFALQRDRPADEQQRPGRRYAGICAPGRRYKQVLIRVYVAQLSAAWTVLGRQPGEDADAYMTLIGYFNSLRELGGMRRLVEDDVQSRLFKPNAENRGWLTIEELTSRKTASEIPQVLDQLGVQRTSRAKPTAEERATKEQFTRASIDVLLATNMISVGVDVPRLGAMVVAGQPRSTSEYIQATSRVGRERPGLVITVYNWARPRDLSHYETFCHYHRTLYKQVEALSVTPFAPRALDRGLIGVLASLLRLGGAEWNPNGGARLVDPADPRAQRARQLISERASGQIGHLASETLSERITVLLHRWREEADVGERTLVYQRRGASDTDVSLLKPPEMEGESDWTVPNSMRNVEPPVPLVLRRELAGQPEAWETPEHAPPDARPDNDE